MKHVRESSIKQHASSNKKNDLSASDTRDYVVYELKCPENRCNAVPSYIGYTTNTLEERMKKKHVKEDSFIYLPWLLTLLIKLF